MSDIGSLLAYRLRQIHRAALLTRMADTNLDIVQARHKKNYDKHARFEPSFAAGEYVSVEHPSLLAGTADCKDY